MPTWQAGPVSAEIILRRVELTLTEAHRAAHGTVADRPTLIVEFRADVGPSGANAPSGWGECPALPDPGYFYEYTAGAWAMLCDVLIPAVIAGGLLTPDAVEGAMSAVPGHPMARSALALAAEDLAARRRNETLAQRWGPAADTLPAGVALSLRTGQQRPSRERSTTGYQGDTSAGGNDNSNSRNPVGSGDAANADLAERAVALAGAGYRRLKIKIQPGLDLVPLGAVSDALRSSGDGDVEVAADANASYRSDDPDHLDALIALDRLGLAWLEQPFTADDLVGHAQLAQRLDTPICLDESVTSLGVVETALALGLRPIMCVKAARLGGPTPARRLLDWCHDEGLDAYIGGMLSSGIGRAADRALAGLAAANRVGDIGGDDRYFTEDVTSPVAIDREGRVPTVGVEGVAGLGVDVDVERLAKLTTDERRWTL